MEQSDNPFANLDKETQQKIQEIQIYEQGFQQLLMQKKSFKFELNEVVYAVQELEKSDGDVFKIVGGQVVIKSEKDKLISELNHKKDLIELRLKNIEKQEEEYSKNIEKIRGEIMEKLTPKKSK